ncbi:inositol monophosphatase family protein [Desulfoplanes formicivorans]|uniref:Inositol-1-monophosphatase n=1 Tax=Desulfoplanes formicivorans TaxID=1592317 RepID=A0A194AEF3_9BACT|nr:inositol monophosphatase family protein [Desulfoplanes formicivorans]GAU08462.1 inositol monophosphatase [Desulfoplanes formicivorans]
MYAKVMEHVINAAHEAGARIKKDWSRPKDVSHKGRIDLVTTTDVQVENLLVSRLGAIIPGSTFWSEETHASSGLHTSTWIIDPIDGTTNFVHQIPFVATSIALWEQGEPVLGVVNLPVMGELFHAIKGQGAFCNGKPIRVSQTEELSASVIATGFPYDIDQEIDPVLQSLRHVLVNAQGVRRAGAAAVDLAYTACGRVDGFYEIGLKPWDTAAGMLLVTEAGGRVSRFDARKPYHLGDRDILASNGHIHQALGACINHA